jgi:hypothetical protein
MLWTEEIEMGKGSDICLEKVGSHYGEFFLPTRIKRGLIIDI